MFLLLGKHFLRKIICTEKQEYQVKAPRQCCRWLFLYRHTVPQGRSEVLGNSGCSCRGVLASARVTHLFSTCLKSDPLMQGMLCFFLLGFSNISLFLVGGCHNLISLAQTVQCSKLPALAWPTIPEEATSGSAFLQLCKTLLSFRYSLQGTL